VITALAFLTRVPVPARPLTTRSLSRAAVWFPVVGALVGAAVAGVRAVVPLDPLPATAVALLAAIVITGALHEDGLADCADALGARGDPLAVLRDPRVGTYGALALVFAILLPLTLLAPLTDAEFLRTVVAAHVLARWAPVALAAAVAPARDDGAGVLLRPGRATVALATGLAAAAALALTGPEALAAALAIAATVGALARRRLGGTTGDVHGACAKLVEIGVYVTAAG
jgi:adenosylcobinamide-GDP ribazoletransferase